jgi:hypothetical protein
MTVRLGPPAVHVNDRTMHIDHRLPPLDDPLPLDRSDETHLFWPELFRSPFFFFFFFSFFFNLLYKIMSVNLCRFYDLWMVCLKIPEIKTSIPAMLRRWVSYSTV